jgi:hypothetical protein
VVLLLAPVPARLKEWVYAGCAITLGSALIAHFAVGDGFEESEVLKGAESKDRSRFSVVLASVELCSNLPGCRVPFSQMAQARRRAGGSK